MAERARNFINGRWQEASTGDAFERRNPADVSQVVGHVVKSGKDDVDRAVTAAREAYTKWRLSPAPRRGEVLFRTAEIIARRKQELGELVTREMGKIIPEGLGDVQEAIDITYYMAGEGRRLTGETFPSELNDKDCKSIRVPVGVCALITPWNFPVAIPAWKLMPALACGNTVVFKPSSHTALCATRLVQILQEAGVPDGVVNLVHGRGEETGEYLAAHEGTDALSFTGSSAVGERLASTGIALRKRVSCEMGGKNAIIVMDDADLTLAIEGALWGAFGAAGQRCTSASRLIVHDAVYDEFLRLFTEAASKLRLGDGLLADTDIGPLVNEAQMQRVLDYIDIGIAERGRVVLGGKRCMAGPCEQGFFIEPTIFVDVTSWMRIAREEIFGPVVCIMKAGSLDEALEIANSTAYGLVASIYTRDVNASATAERDLETGIVYVNASTIGAEVHLPFGGVKRSGIGHLEAGGRGGALDMFSRWKVIYRDYSGKLQKAQIDR